MQTFNSVGGRVIGIAWMQQWQTKQNTNTLGFSGVMSLPREFSIQNNYLLSNPCSELQKLRTSKTGLHRLKKLTPEEAILFTSLPDLREIYCYIPKLHLPKQLTFNVVMGENNEKISLTFNQKYAVCYLDETNTGGIIHHCSPVLNLDCGLTLRLFIDRGCIDIFINNGVACASHRFYWKEKKERALSILCTDTAECDFSIWQLSSIWAR